MKRLSTICLVAVMLTHSGVSLGAARVGVGFSTVTSGRQIPALELGVGTSDWAASGMLAGARTEAYYTTGILVNGMKVKDWGEFWFGRLEVGFGGGVYYGEKGAYTDVDAEGKPIDLEKDQDFGIGPAFRVAFKPFTNVHVSLEYMMGLGLSVLSNAYQDVGMGAIGVDL